METLITKKLKKERPNWDVWQTSIVCGKIYIRIKHDSFDLYDLDMIKELGGEIFGIHTSYDNNCCVLVKFKEE